MASLRVRIVAVAVLLVGSVVSVSAFAVVANVRAELLDTLDRTLEQRAELIAAGIDASPDSDLADSNAEDRFAQVVDESGIVVAATPNVRGADPVAGAPQGRVALVDRADLAIEDDTFRVLALTMSRGGYVVVGENIDDTLDDVRVLRDSLLLAVPITVGVLALAMWWIIGRTLRPVEAIRSEVAGIGVDELHRRVAVPRTGDEVARLAATMNDMLVRLEGAVAQQRSFVADASHELRTPLTRLRTSLEVDLASNSPARDLEATCRRAVSDTVAMQQLVDDLLFLARHDALDRAPTDRRAGLVDLDDVIETETRAARESAEQDIRVDLSGVSAVVVPGYAADLGRAVSNLLSNALRHARREVSVRLHVDGGDAVVLIDDDGPGIPPADRERVFDRFTRLDHARSASDGGSGLGLAIVREIVTAHGGTVALDVSPSGGTRVVVRLPLP